jgi:hypothetical protein
VDGECQESYKAIFANSVIQIRNTLFFWTQIAQINADLYLRSSAQSASKNFGCGSTALRAL